MKRVLVISSSTVFRGAEQVLIDTLPRLTEVRIRVLSSKVASAMQDAVASIEGVSYEKTRWMGNWGAGHGGGLWPKFLKLSNFVLGSWTVWRESLRADLVLGNNTGDVIYSVFARLAGRPFVLHCHDDRFSSEHAGMIRLFAPFVTRYIAVSDSVSKALKDVLGDPSLPVDIVHNGLAEIPCRPYTLESGKLKLCWIGAIEERKDPLAFVDLLDRLVVAGYQVEGVMAFREADNALLEALKARVNASKANIRLAGAVRRDEIHDLVSDCGYLAVTSKSDPLPTVVIEAFRAGRPVVAKGIASLRAMVDHDQNGLLYDPEADPSFDRLVGNLGRFDHARGCEVARATFQEKYSLASKVQRLMAVFGTVGNGV